MRSFYLKKIILTEKEKQEAGTTGTMREQGERDNEENRMDERGGSRRVKGRVWKEEGTSDEGGCTRDEDTGFKWNSIVD